jgi:hypothetical protein
VNGDQGPPRWGDEAPSVIEPLTGEELNRLWADPPGLRGQLTGVQNDNMKRDSPGEPGQTVLCSVTLWGVPRCSIRG